MKGVQGRMCAMQRALAARRRWPGCWQPPPAQSPDQQEGRISSTMRVQDGSHRRSRDQGGPGHTDRAADRLHGDSCRSRRRGRCRCARICTGNDRNRSAEPVNLVQQVHAVFLSGGSAFGLDVATGVRKYLYERKIGFETRVAKVPIVPGAILFDLGVGNRPDIWPTADCGYRAAAGATSGPSRKATSVRVPARRSAKRAAAGR